MPEPRQGFKRVEPDKRNEVPAADRWDFEAREAEREAARAADEPTDEQLENLAHALGFHILASPIFKTQPHWRQALLNLHGLVQRSLNGDAEADAMLELLRDRFGDRA